MSVGSPHVSVVIPTRNRVDFVTEAIESALAQQDVEVEVIVVDDGSTDDTPAKLKAITDDRVKVVRREDDHGEPQARNAGVAVADNDLLAFLDDDDKWTPSKLSRQLDALATSGADWSITGARVTNMLGASLAVRTTDRLQRAVDDGRCLRQFLTTNQVPGPGSSLLVRASVFHQVGGFNPDVALFADWDLYIRLAAHGNPALVNEPLVEYLQHEGQMTKDLTQGWVALAGFRERYAELRTENDVRVADESVLWWIASRQRKKEGTIAVLRRLGEADLVREPSDLFRLARTMIGISKERLGS